MKIRFQQQSEHSECGLSCASMIIDYFEEKTALSMLRKEYGVPNGGYNIHQIITVLKDKNVETKAIKVKDCDITTLPTPFIAYWNKKHFIVVEKALRGKIQIVDPGLGKLRITLEEFTKNFSNVAIVVQQHKRKRRLSFPTLNLSILNSFRENKAKIGCSFFIAFLMQICSLATPYLIQALIDRGKLIENGFSEIVWIASLIATSYFFTNLSRTRIITSLQTSFDRSLLSSTIKHLLELPYSFFVNRSKGELIYRINSNSYIRQILTDNGINLAVNIIFCFIYLGIMFSFNKILASVTLLITMILIIVSVLNARISRKISQNEMVVQTKSQDIVNELVNNIFTIKSTNSQKNIFKNWQTNFDEQIKLERLKAKSASYLVNIPQTLQTFYPLIIFVIGIWISTKNGISVGNIVAFNVIGVAFLTPIVSIMGSYSQLELVRIYLDRLIDILDTPVEAEYFGDELLRNFGGGLELRNASYKYSKFSGNALKKITLKIEPNEKVAIVGQSGSGKSTLLKLLSCLTIPTEGELFYDSVNVSSLKIESIRANIGVVLQENLLFNGSLCENITMGRSFSEQDIWNTIREANLNELVEQFPLKLETMISESGQNLSGGQRQKISLARTLISEPKAIFLDEPTSALDNISERNVMKNLFKKRATVVVVAHRLSTIKDFDKVIVMSEGKIVGCDTHEALLKNNEYYKELYLSDEQKARNERIRKEEFLVS